ncbi:MAG: ABC transporter substrate-binding protein [Acidimicrobiia bacterium]
MRRVLASVVLLAAVAGLLAAGAGAATPPSTSSSPASSAGIGVSRTILTVGGIVGTDALSVGADIGAQARFARANRARELKGRSVQYLRTESVADAATADAAAARLANEVFAVVPAVGPSVGAAMLARERVPFFGSASTVEWYANRTGFGFAGAAVTERTRIASSPLGVQLRATLGGATAAVAVLYDDGPAGVVRAAEVRKSLRAAGFRDIELVAVPFPPAPFDTTALAARPGTSVNVFLTSSPRTSELVGRLVAAGSTATMVVGSEFYTPTVPAAASGLTVLTAVAAFEEATAGNRRLAADVEAFAPGTALTPAIAAGYWSADLFLRGLDATGKTLTRVRLLDAMNAEHFMFSVAGTVGRSTWPEMHTQPVPCGSLAQSDGTQFVVVAPYGCAPARPR